MTTYLAFEGVDKGLATKIAEKERKTGKGFLAKLKGEKPESIEYIENFFIPVQVWTVSYAVKKGLIRKKMETFVKEICVIPTNPKLDMKSIVVDLENLIKNYGKPAELSETLEEQRILPTFDFSELFEEFKEKIREKLRELKEKVDNAIEEYKRAHEAAKWNIEEAWRSWKEYTRETDRDFKQIAYSKYKGASKSARSLLDRGKKAYEKAFKDLKKFVNNIKDTLSEILGKDAKNLIDVTEPEKYSVKLPRATYKIPVGSVDLRDNLDEVSLSISDKTYLIPVYIVKYVSEKGTRFLVISKKGKDSFLQKFIESESVINFLS